MGCGCGRGASKFSDNGIPKCTKERYTLTVLKKRVKAKANITSDTQAKSKLINTSNEIAVLLSNRHYCPTEEFLKALTDEINGI